MEDNDVDIPHPLDSPPTGSETPPLDSPPPLYPDTPLDPELSRIWKQFCVDILAISPSRRQLNGGKYISVRGVGLVCRDIAEERVVHRQTEER